MIYPFYFARKGLHLHNVALVSSIGGRILDIECGSKPYKFLFTVLEYIRMEISGGNPETDCYYNGKQFPFQHGEFGSLMTNQELEHVFDSEEFLSESNRVVKDQTIRCF